MPKSTEKFNPYSMEEAREEAKKMQEKISSGEAMDYYEAEMQIEQEQKFPEQFKFDPKTKTIRDGFDMESVNVWVDLRGTKFAEKNSFGEEREGDNTLIRQRTYDLVKIYESFGEEGLENFLKFNRLKLKELSGKKLFDSINNLKTKIEEKNYPDDILHPQLALPDDILHSKYIARRKESDTNKITHLKIGDYLYTQGEKDVYELAENYDGGNSLRGESSTYYREKRTRPCWYKKELSDKEILENFQISGIGTISDVKFEKPIVDEDEKTKSGQKTSEMIDNLDLKIVKEIIDLKETGGRNSDTWYYQGISEEDIMSRREKGERVASIENSVNENLKSELFKFLQSNLEEKTLNSYEVKSSEDIKFSVEANSESFPRYFSVKIGNVGNVGFYRNIFRISGNFNEEELGKEEIEKKSEDLEFKKIISSFCLQQLSSDKPKIEKQKVDKTLSVQDHQGRIGFKPSFEDKIVFYNLTDQELLKSLVPGQEYGVEFIGEEEPIMDYKTKKQKKDKRGTPMFKQKVKVIL